jgi:acyl-coenzyme A synthetase/AMP-(fatty) acid ligase/thioesterase domain-containing protein
MFEVSKRLYMRVDPQSLPGEDFDAGAFVRTTAPPASSILDIVRDLAVVNPSATIVDDGQLRLSRRDLYAAAVQLAAELVQTAPAGQPVGIFLGNEARFLIAALACIGAGCPFVTLDVRYPVARNREFLLRAKIAAIIENSDRPFSDRFPGADTLPHLGIGATAIERAASCADVGAAPRPLGLHDPFVVLFTSGSTGSPKGVVHSQYSMLHTVRADVDIHELSGHDRWLGILSPATMFGLSSALSTLQAGAVAVLRDPRAGLGQLIDTLRDERITILRCVPSLMRAIAHVDGAREAMRSLRIVHMGGERVYGTDIGLLRPLLSDSCRILVGFGSTEGGLMAYWFVDGIPRGLVPTGYPIPGTSLEIVAPDGTPVQPGEVGEVKCSSPATALGFWNGEAIEPGDITLASDDGSARSYLTGDLFRRNDDGRLDNVGRLDRMVKIRGYRVDLGDVEAAVRAWGGVRDAAVVGSSLEGTARITAFVVSEHGARRSASHLRGALRAHLAEHMIPADVRFIDAIPQLPGFKPDIAKLERLAQEGRRPQALLRPARAAPSGRSIADVVATVWTDVLGGESYANDERWDDSGGDSLMMLQLAYGLERLLRKPVALELMSSSMRPSDLVERLTDAPEPVGPPASNSRTVILLPGLRGDEPKLVEFRKMLGADVRFFVPFYASWDTLVMRDVSFADIVDDIINQIRQNVRDRPLIFLGYSFGGLIAHEVARQLVDAGDAVAFVGMLDSYLGPFQSDLDPALAGQGGGLSGLARDVRKVGLSNALATRAGYRIAVIVHRSRTLLRTVARQSRRLPLSSNVAFSFHFFMTAFVRRELAKTWQPGTLSASTTFFRSQSHGANAAHDLGWGRHTTSLRVENVAGTHASMILGPNAEQLALKIRRAINSYL